MEMDANYFHIASERIAQAFANRVDSAALFAGTLAG
jgi:hypothetical protein